MKPHRLHVSDWAASELSLRAEVADLEDDSDVLAALSCWSGGSFVVPADADLWAIWRGLCAMGNDCASYAEHDRHPETRKHYRWACDGLGGLCDRVMRMIRDAGVPYLTR